MFFSIPPLQGDYYLDGSVLCRGRNNGNIFFRLSNGERSVEDFRRFRRYGRFHYSGWDGRKGRFIKSDDRLIRVLVLRDLLRALHVRTNFDRGAFRGKLYHLKIVSQGDDRQERFVPQTDQDFQGFHGLRPFILRVRFV